MQLRVSRSAVPYLAVLAVMVSSRPALAKENGVQPAVTAQAPVVLWSSAAHASGKELSAALFELPAGTSCHVAEAHKAAPLWSCTLGELTVSGFAGRAAFTKQGAPRADPESDFWKRLRRYSDEWVRCMDPKVQPKSCGKVLMVRLSLFWAARSAEAPMAGIQKIRCPLDPAEQTCPDHGCEQECFSHHLGEGRLFGDTDGMVFLQPAGKDLSRMFTATGGLDEESGANRMIAPPMPLFDPMLVSLLGAVDHTHHLRLGISGRVKGTFLELPKRSSRFRTRLRLDGSRPFVVCDKQIVRPTLARPARILFEEDPLLDMLLPIHEYALPCASSLVLGEKVPGIRAGAKSADRFGTPPRVKTHPDGESLSVGALTLRGESSERAPRLRNCRLELGSISGGNFHACEADYAGDLNGDGKEDFVLDLRGEAGCGGSTLFLSSPEGWKKVTQNFDVC